MQGAIKDHSGTFSFDAEKGEKSAVEVVAKAATIDTFNEGRDKHLRGEDFFDVEKYPELKFKSTAWKKTGDATYDVTGDFTLHGVTKSHHGARRVHRGGQGHEGRGARRLRREVHD